MPSIDANKDAFMKIYTIKRCDAPIKGYFVNL